MFDSLFGLAGDVVKTAAAPLDAAFSLTRAVTKPVADASSEWAQALKEALEDK